MHKTTSALRSPNPDADEGDLKGTENLENVKVDISRLRQNENQNDLDTRLEPKSNKESSKVEITVVVQPVNVNKEEEESAEDDYELKLREKGSIYTSPSTLGNQEQLDDFDFWTDSYATDDDELPTEKVSQELVEEMSQTIDEAKLRNVVNEMLRQ
nr:hypothetical protein [Tanacetum cinerariifolium]